MRAIEDSDLHYIETQDDVSDFFMWLGERRSVLCVDTETTGLRYWLPNFRVRLIQFGDAENGFVMRADRFGAVAEKVLSEYNTSRITGHNMFSFDYHALTAAGFSFPDLRLVDDTLMMSKLAQANQFDHSLKGQGTRHFGKIAGLGQGMLDEAFEAHGFRSGRGATVEQSEEAWSNIPYDCEAYYLYSGFDTVLGARLHKKLKPLIDSQFSEAYARALASWAVTVKHEHKGLRVDLSHANALHDEMSQDIQIVRTQLAELGVPNPGARQKLAKKLIDEGWVPEEYSKKSGNPKLDKSVLEGIDHEVVGPLMEWSRLTKWRTAYVESVLSRAHNGRVYPSINHFGAKTGRQSAFGPPIHQFPAKHEDAWKIRRMILPEEGQSCVSIDYNAQENRLLYHFSEDKALKRIFDEGLDIHTYSASGVYEIDYDAVTPEQRGIVKNRSYAAAYGAQDLKLAKMMGVSVEEAKIIAARVDSVFSGVTAYKERLEREGRAQFNAEGYAYATTWGGRRVYADQGKYGEPKYFTLVNYVNQGTGGDILNEAQNRIAAAGLDDHIMFELHDEFLLSVPRGPEGLEIAKEVGRIMEFTNGEFKIDLPTSVGEQSEYWSGH